MTPEQRQAIAEAWHQRTHLDPHASEVDDVMAWVKEVVAPIIERPVDEKRREMQRRWQQSESELTKAQRRIDVLENRCPYKAQVQTLTEERDAALEAEKVIARLADALRVRAESAEAALRRVRDLHREDRDGCLSNESGICSKCRHVWPCATYRAAASQETK